MLALLASLGFSQDINRAKEWSIKRAEQPESTVIRQMSANGVVSAVGSAPVRLDPSGNPTDTKSGSANESDSSTTEDKNTVGRHSDVQTSGQFQIADAALPENIKEKPSPIAIVSSFLIIGLLIAVTFRVATNRIKVPANL